MSDSNSSLTIRVGVAGGAQTVASIDQIASSVMRVGASIATALVPQLLVLASVTATFDAIKNSLEGVARLGDTLQELHLQTGASVASLTAIEQVFHRIGESADDAGMMVSRMQRNITDALTGSGAMQKDFSALGLDPKALSSMTADKQLLAIGEALNKVANDGQRAQLAMAMFGRSGAQMLQVFRDPVAMKLLGGGASSSFAQAMQSIAEPMHNIMATMREANEIPTKIMAGVFEQLPVQELQQKIESAFDSIDWTQAGRKAGAFVDVVINAIKAGQLPEILSLVIQAGFELGTNAVKHVWLDQWKAILSPTAGEIEMALIDAVMSFGVGAAKLLISYFTDPIIFMAAGFDWLGDHLREVFEDAINWFAGAWNDMMKKLPGGSHMMMGQIQDIQPADSWDTDVKKQQDFAGPAARGISDYLTKQLQASQSILGINEKLSASDDTRTGAVARLNALINEQLNLTQTAAATDTVANGAVVQGTDIRKTMAAQEIALKQQLMELDQKMAQIEGDYAMTTAQKYSEKKIILEQMAAILQHIIDANNKVIASPTTSDTDKQLLLQRNTGYESQLSGVEDKESKLGPDPNSFKAQWTSVITGLQNKFGTFATQTSSLFESVFNNAVSSISKGITGLIEGTMTWKKALMDISTSVVNDIIQGIVKMGVQWVMTQIMMSVFGRSLQGAATATTAATGAAQAASLAPAATMSTIASFGSSAVTAAPLILGAIGAVAGGFMTGGYTGDGSPWQTAGIVHKGEFVFSAPAVDRIGVDNLEALHTNATGAGGSAPGGGGNTSNKFVLVANLKQAALEAMASPQGEKVTIGHVNKNKNKLGFQT